MLDLHVSKDLMKIHSNPPILHYDFKIHFNSENVLALFNNSQTVFGATMCL